MVLREKISLNFTDPSLPSFGGLGWVGLGWVGLGWVGLACLFGLFVCLVCLACLFVCLACLACLFGLFVCLFGNTKGILKRVLKAKLKEKSLGVQNHYVLCEKFSTKAKNNT